MNRPIFIPGMDDSKPGVQVAIIDGQPEQVVNLHMIGELIKGSPLGVPAAFEAAVGYVGDQYRERLRSMVFGGAV